MRLTEGTKTGTVPLTHNRAMPPHSSGAISQRRFVGVLPDPRSVYSHVPRLAALHRDRAVCLRQLSPGRSLRSSLPRGRERQGDLSRPCDRWAGSRGHRLATARRSRNALLCPRAVYRRRGLAAGRESADATGSTPSTRAARSASDAPHANARGAHRRQPPSLRTTLRRRRTHCPVELPRLGKSRAHRR